MIPGRGWVAVARAGRDAERRKRGTHIVRGKKDYDTLCVRCMRDYLKGQVGAWAPRHPQWQHWGELADVGQGAESTAQGTGTAPMGADADGCDETADATERETGTAADADAKACMADVWVVGSVGGW